MKSAIVCLLAVVGTANHACSSKSSDGGGTKAADAALSSGTAGPEANGDNVPADGGTAANGENVPSSGGTTASAATDPESEPADSPSMVAGAFLTCGPVDAKQGDQIFGCVFRDKDKHKKLQGKAASIVATVKLKGGSTLSPEVKAASDDSPWHVTFPIPSDASAKVEKLTIEATLASTKTTKATRRVDQAPNAVVYLAPGVLFVTSRFYRPGVRGFSGKDGADQLCAQTGKTLADSAAERENWRAVLFAHGSDLPTFLDRFLNGFINSNSSALFLDSLQFWTSFRPDAPLLTETHTLPPVDSDGNATVWTGLSGVFSFKRLTPTGLSGEQHNCRDWVFEGAADTGVYGVAFGLQQGDWLANDTVACDQSLHIYCLGYNNEATQ